MNTSGTILRDLRDSNVLLSHSVPNASSTLSRIITEILDYLSVEELHSIADETAVVFRGSAKFGGEGRANPELPPSQSITSSGGQELSWLDNMIAFRLTIPRRGPGPAFDTTGLSGNDLNDLQQLNELLNGFADVPAGSVSDSPGSDFRLEMLIRTVRLVLPKDIFIPARVGADGWLEPDPAFKEVVLEFPQLAIVIEQQGEPGNLNFKLKSWDSAGFDYPGDVDTGRFFTLTPPLFLHRSRWFGFGIERIVADFSDNITPPEILEQFGIGDDFNGIWMPLVRVFIAPGRTTGLAFSARGKDMLFDVDKGFSGELALDILNRGGKLTVEPIFYGLKAKAPLEWTRGKITRNNDGTIDVTRGTVKIPGEGEMHLSIHGSISPYQVSVHQRNGQDDPDFPLPPDISAGVDRPKWNIPASGIGRLVIEVSDKDRHNTWHEAIYIEHVQPKGPVTPPYTKYETLFVEGPADSGFHIIKDDDKSEDRVLVLRLTPDFPPPTLTNGPQIIPRHPDGLFHMTLTPGDAPARFIAVWQPPPVPPVPGDLSTVQQKDLINETVRRTLRLHFNIDYPLPPPIGPEENRASKVAAKILQGGNFSGVLGTTIDLNGDLPEIDDFLKSTQGKIVVFGFASFEKERNFPRDSELSDSRSEILSLLISSRLGVLNPSPSREIENKGYSHDAAELDGTIHSDKRFRVALAVAAPKSLNNTASATAELVPIAGTPVTDPPVEHPPAALEPERPPIFRRIGFRVRYERGQLGYRRGKWAARFSFRC